MKSLRLLLIEDSEDDAMLLELELRKGGMELEFVRVDTPQELEASLEGNTWDAVIADYNLPTFTGLDALRIIRAKGLDLPFILVSGVIGEEKAVEAMKAGAHDYIMKGNFPRLAPALNRELRDAEVRRERRQALEELQHAHDELEIRVRQRTDELSKANEVMRAEIAERERTEEALRESRQQNEFLANIIELSSQPFGVGYPDGRLGIVNKAYEQLTGYSADELKSLDWAETLTPPEWREAEHDKLKELHRTGRQVRYEKECLRKDGTRVPVELLVNLATDPDGKPEYYYAFVTDITERKQSEQELLKAKEAAEAANRAKSQFLANMSHELRTPMTGLLGMLDLVLAGNIAAQQREYINIARKSGSSLLRILNDILDLTKIEAGKLSINEEPFALREWMANTLDIFTPEAMRNEIEFIVCADNDLPETLVGDQARLRQALTNLVGNAVKFTTHGKVEVRIAAGRQLDNGKRDITFTITDTGIGIPSDKKQLLFHSFSQLDDSHSRAYGGTGLGLAISKEIVELMGGTITFDSKYGMGSTFTFTVPLGEAATERETGRVSATSMPVEEKTAVRSAEGKKARLLLAEDDPTIRHLLEMMLRLSDFEPEIAEDGRKAVEMWEEGDYDLVLMDVQMPLMDGFSATRAIREKEQARGYGHTLIVAMTAHALKRDEERCLEAGMDAYISKPVDLKASITLIKELLSQRDT